MWKWKHVDHGTFRRKLRNWISWRVVDLTRCLADKFESFLHDKFICQRVEDACELFRTILQSVHSTDRNSNLYWFLRIKWLCKMNMIRSSISSTLWQMNLSCEADSNLSAKHFRESTTRWDIQLRNFRLNVPWSTCFHIDVVGIKAIWLPNRPNRSLIGLRKRYTYCIVATVD